MACVRAQLDPSQLPLPPRCAGCRYKVEAACREIGGKLVEAAGDVSKAAAALGSAHRFSFSFLQRQWATNWGLGSSPGNSSSCGST